MHRAHRVASCQVVAEEVVVHPYLEVAEGVEVHLQVAAGVEEVVDHPCRGAEEEPEVQVAPEGVEVLKVLLELLQVV